MITPTQTATLTLDGREVPCGTHRNVLELARAQGIDIPTFCYHSHLSTYGACRLCLVDVLGRGVVTSCTTTPEPGMVIRTETAEIREMRKVTLELLLANHDMRCTTCDQSGACRLQDLSRRFGIDEVRFRSVLEHQPIDLSSPALRRNADRCILCGDCVRACEEVQSVGAIGFSGRGAATRVEPPFGQPLDESECVGCGHCAAVCPTGSLMPADDTARVNALLDDPARRVVLQIAPAVRSAVAEAWGLDDGVQAAGRIAAAARRLGFAQVYDTAFAADLTVWEEASEFVARFTAGEKLPLFTSCCPAWVRFAEQYLPQLLPNLSTCRSPQQMFGSLAKRLLPEKLGVAPEQLAVVAIMPCTAKKLEAARPEFRQAAGADVEAVLTTTEFLRMVAARGFDPARLDDEDFDAPFGEASGAGVIFGASGGVSEAVLRFARSAGLLAGGEASPVLLDGSMRLLETRIGDRPLRLAVVHTLARARELCEQILAGTTEVDLVEVMACPGGCVAGAGQPTGHDHIAAARRRDALCAADACLPTHDARDNAAVATLYHEHLAAPGSHSAHDVLHTGYRNRRRGIQAEVPPPAVATSGLPVSVCLGTGCYLRGADALLRELGRSLEEQGLAGRVALSGRFCQEHCDRGPSVSVGERLLHGANAATALAAVREALD